MSDEESKVDDAFRQLDGALCLWSRAKGETPYKQYIEKVTTNVRRVIIGNDVFQVIITPVEDDDKR